MVSRKKEAGRRRKSLGRRPGTLPASKIAGGTPRPNSLIGLASLL
jgi:hypothetical protein